MKKMVCEICGSLSIRKLNGVFVCQECGTEYSLDEARNLLKDVSDESSESTIHNKNTELSGKEKLLAYLQLWVLNLSKLPDLYLWFNITRDKINTDGFWINEINNISSKTRIADFPKIESSPIFLSSFIGIKGGGHHFWDTSFYDNPSFKTSYPKDYELSISSREMSCRFYNKNSDISGIIEDEARNDVFQKKLYDFFNENRELEYNGYPIYTTFPSLIGKPKVVPGKGVVTEITSVPAITELSREYNTILVENPNAFSNISKYSVQSPTQKYEAILKAGSDIVHEFINKHNEMMDYCEEHYDDMCDLVKMIKENCLKLESSLFVPYKYRSVPILLNLIDLVNDGKATNWQDLINLYDTHQYRAGVYEKLDTINTKLDTIQNTLVIGFTAITEQLNEVNANLKDMNSKMDTINKELRTIRKYNFITMWNSL